MRSPCQRPAFIHLVLFLSLFTAKIALADLSFVTAPTITALKLNNTTDHKGFKFKNTCGTSITITQLGRWVISGNNQKHTLSIFDSSPTPVQVASVVVNCFGATPGQFLYGALPSPYVLPAGASCYIVSSETDGGDQWHSNGGTNLTTTNIGSIVSARIEGGVAIDGTDNTRSFGPVSFRYSSPLPNWSKSGTTYTTDGSPYSVNSAIKDASAGDTVSIPEGTFTWGDSGAYVLVNKPISLRGAGRGRSIINISPTARTYANGTIVLYSSATVSGLTINQSGKGTTTAFATANSISGWRITDITYNSGNQAGYFVFAAAYGLVDDCTINTISGSDEPIFVRGPTDAWQTATNPGSSDGVYIEDCIFDGPGYPDFNSNARGVFRFNTILGRAKIDGHGVASNSPPRGVRLMEVYSNTWTNGTDFWTAIEMRGGTGMIFNNKAINAVPGRCWFSLTDYGYTAPWPNFGGIYQTMIDYPVKDQIGVGIDPKIAGSDPMYLWDNLAAETTGAGSATVDWSLQWKAIPSEAIALYRAQTGNAAATYVLQEVIKADRDYFKHTHGATFDGSSGVGVGTKSQMNAIRPTKIGVGFWVTDEGEWNSINGAEPDGQLYVWNGSSWVFKYKPYTYPHPMRTGGTATGLPDGIPGLNPPQ